MRTKTIMDLKELRSSLARVTAKAKRSGRSWFGLNGDLVARRANVDAGNPKRVHDRVVGAFVTVREFFKAGGGAFPEYAHVFHETANDWVRILKLSAKLAILDLKTRYLRRKNRILSAKVGVLTREQHELLLHQVNHILGQSGGAAKPNDLFGGVNGAHGVPGQTNEPAGNGKGIAA